MKKHVTIKRLNKLADFLDTVPRPKFDLSLIRREPNPDYAHPKEVKCGTVACAMGWMPEAFPRAGIKPINGEIGFKDQDTSEVDTFKTAQTFFGIGNQEAEGLFNTGNFMDSQYLGDQATPKQVAKRIRKYTKALEKGKVYRDADSEAVEGYCDVY